MELPNFNTVSTRPSYVKALIYGQAGAGKTRFCADAPGVVWLDFEDSTETLRHYPEFKDIPVKKPSSIEQLNTLFEALVKNPDVETVVIDSITTALDFYMRQEAEKNEKRNPKRDRFVFYEADYKYATQVFTDLFGRLQNAPINVVIIGHERIEKNSEHIVTGIYPDITPRLQQAVTRLVNVVGYFELRPSSLKGNTRRLYLNRTPTIEAKNRLNIQDTFLDNPSWDSLFKSIKETL